MSEFGGLWIHERTQHALYNKLGLGSATLSQLTFLGESDRIFNGKKIALGQQHVPQKSMYGSMFRSFLVRIFSQTRYINARVCNEVEEKM